MTEYQLTEYANVVRRKDEVLSGSPWTYIPFDEANTDYQQYLAWLAEGNTPLPPDAPTEETK